MKYKNFVKKYMAGSLAVMLAVSLIGCGKQAEKQVVTVELPVTTSAQAGYYLLTGDDGGKSVVNKYGDAAVGYTVDKDGNITDQSGSVLVAAANAAAYIPVASITFTGGDQTVDPGASVPLTVEIKPDDATCKDYRVESSSADVVAISEDKSATAVNPGDATVTAHSYNGDKTAACTVTVNAPPAAPVETPAESTAASGGGGNTSVNTGSSGGAAASPTPSPAPDPAPAPTPAPAPEPEKVLYDCDEAMAAGNSHAASLGVFIVDYSRTPDNSGYYPGARLFGTDITSDGGQPVLNAAACGKVDSLYERLLARNNGNRDDMVKYPYKERCYITYRASDDSYLIQILYG